MVKKTQSIEGKNSTFFLAFSHPDWFLPYVNTPVWQYSSYYDYIIKFLYTQYKDYYKKW